MICQATFLAAVQAQIIGMALSRNSSRLEVATNAFAFMGVIFDVIAALLALLASTVMQTRISVIDRILCNAEKVHNEQAAEFVVQVLRDSHRTSRFIRAMLQDVLHPISKRLEKLATAEAHHDYAPEFDSKANAAQVIKCCGNLDGIRVFGDAAGTAMLFGILCFILSVICLAISTQPTAVWVPTVAACSCVVILPSVNSVLAIVGFRKYFLYLPLHLVNNFDKDCRAFLMCNCREDYMGFGSCTVGRRYQSSLHNLIGSNAISDSTCTSIYYTTQAVRVSTLRPFL